SELRSVATASMNETGIRRRCRSKIADPDGEARGRMRAIEVFLNGSVLCMAGTDQASLLTIHLDLNVEDPGQGTLRVTGMNDLEEQRSSHTTWLEETIVREGDILRFRFVDSAWATTPTAERATDSEEYIAEQAWYESEVLKSPLAPRVMLRGWPRGSLAFRLPGAEPVIATFEGEHAFISLSLIWNRWRPDNCRYALSSFSQAEAIAGSGTKKWVEGSLQLDELCEVRVET